MQEFSEQITFQEGQKPLLAERYMLSNWKDDVWNVEGRSLIIQKDRVAEVEERKARVLEVYGEPHSWIRIQNAPWIALSTGDRTWLDYTASVRLRPTARGRSGMAFRWEDARHYYAFLLEYGERIAVYRREHDDFHLLGCADFPHHGEQAYVMTAKVNGSHLFCSVEGGPEISLNDQAYASGGVALLTESPAAYEFLNVEGTCRPKPTAIIDSLLIPREEKRVLLPEISSYRDAVYRFVSIGGDPHLLIYDRGDNALACVDHGGTLVYTLGPWERRLGGGGDIPVQVFDLDADGEEELLLIADYRIEVHNARNGELLRSEPTPASNPYGEGRNNPDPRVAGDAVCPVRIAREGPCRFYLKDRYWNIWLYDHRLDLLWTQARNTGHFPLPVDVDGDGRDEILCGPALLDVSGGTLWEIRLDDHFDAIGHFDLRGDGKRWFYVMAGEEGLLRIHPERGELVRQRKLGHVQKGVVGRFVDDREDYQLLVSTLWREPGIHYLVDADLKELARWEGGMGSPWPLPWGKRDLYLCGSNILDAVSGQMLFSLGDEETVHAAWVLDWPGSGPSRIAAVSDGVMLVYGPTGQAVNRPSPLGRFYSNYLPRGSPGW